MICKRTGSVILIVEGKAFNQSAGNPIEKELWNKKTFSRKQRIVESGGKDGK